MIGIIIITYIASLLFGLLISLMIYDFESNTIPRICAIPVLNTIFILYMLLFILHRFIKWIGKSLYEIYISVKKWKTSDDNFLKNVINEIKLW